MPGEQSSPLAEGTDQIERLDSTTIATRMGVPRHPTRHILRLDPSSLRWTVMHSQECLDSGEPLETCRFSSAAATTNYEHPIWRGVTGPCYVVCVGRVLHPGGRADG